MVALLVALLLCISNRPGVSFPLLTATAPSWAALQEILPTYALQEPLVIDPALDNCMDAQPELSKDLIILFRERNGWCPYSQRVWLALEYKSVEYNTILIDNTGRKPSWYGGNTPSVVWPSSGQRQSESMDIIERLDVEYPGTRPLYPQDAKGKSEVKRFISAFGDTFPRMTRPSSRSAFLFQSNGMPVFKAEFEKTLEKTDLLLTEHKSGPFFLGDKFTAADIAWIPFLERYAYQLPILHIGLNPRDSMRWPNLAKWYDAIEQYDCMRGCYAGKCQGDQQSWAKVLNQAGYGNDGVMPDVQESGWVSESEMLQSHSLKCEIFAKYAQGKEYVADTPYEEAAVRIVRNQARLKKDIIKYFSSSSSSSSSSGSISEDDVDVGLRYFCDLLLAGENDGLDALPTCSSDLGMEVEAMLVIAQKIAGYFDDRMCIPRDMSILSAHCIRKLFRKLTIDNGG